MVDTANYDSNRNGANIVMPIPGMAGLLGAGKTRLIRAKILEQVVRQSCSRQQDSEPSGYIYITFSHKLFLNGSSAG